MKMLYPRAQTVRSTFQNCTSDHHIYQNAGAVQLNILFKCMGYSGWKRYRVELRYAEIRGSWLS